MGNDSDPKTAADDGYRKFLISQHGAIASVKLLDDAMFTWCYMVAVRAGLPQQVLADKISVTQPTISRWSRGDNLPKNPVVRQAYVSELLSSFADFIVAAGGPRLISASSHRPTTKHDRASALAASKPR